MSGGRFPMDLSTGMTDLCWNLVMFFFVCTVVLARPALVGLPDAAAEGDGGDAPAIIRIAGVGPEAWGSASVSSTGGRPAPAEGEGVLPWLTRTCTAATAVLVCPEDASHRECRAIVAEAMSAAPDCRVQY